jgi:hypothetical protein
LQIARASEFFPEVITKLRSGEAKPSHMALAVGKLTKANAPLVFNAMNGRSKRQYQAELAKITPDGRLDQAAAPVKTKLSFACNEGEVASFEHLRGLLVTQGRLAGSGSEDIFSLMVEMCLDQVDPLRRAERAAARQAQKKAAAARASAAAQAPDEALVPGPDLSTPPRRYVPAAVRHEVVQRAQGQCEFVGDEGRRCSARVGLELDHHAVLFCRGGRHEARDLELTCAGHNGLRAERQLGRDFMAKKIQEARTGYKGDERPGGSRPRPSPHGLD